MTRRRYWARALGGYERVKQAQPNDAHHAIRDLIIDEKIHCLITQNVDGLHQKSFKSGNSPSSISRNLDDNIIDLHGRIDRVICMKCNHIYSRDYIQEVIYSMNPLLRKIYQQSDHQEMEKRMRADGDMDLQNLVDYTKVLLEDLFFDRAKSCCLFFLCIAGVDKRAML
jgi:NAD-dependent SIR2 family protein deacetylase